MWLEIYFVDYIYIYLVYLFDFFYIYVCEVYDYLESKKVESGKVKELYD